MCVWTRDLLDSKQLIHYLKQASLSLCKPSSLSSSSLFISSVVVKVFRKPDKSGCFLTYWSFEKVTQEAWCMLIKHFLSLSCVFVLSDHQTLLWSVSSSGSGSVWSFCSAETESLHSKLDFLELGLVCVVIEFADETSSPQPVLIWFNLLHFISEQ